jgi:predicted aconitase with swiveling domain
VRNITIPSGIALFFPVVNAECSLPAPMPSSRTLRSMAEAGRAPLALLLNTSNPIMARARPSPDLPFTDRFETDITQLVATGDRITVDPGAGQVIIYKR